MAESFLIASTGDLSLCILVVAVAKRGLLLNAAVVASKLLESILDPLVVAVDAAVARVVRDVRV